MAATQDFSHSLPAMMHRSQHGEEESTQARLMKTRGDLSKTAFSFDASLPAPGPGARAKGLGMEVVRSDNQAGPGEALLVVADVDKDPRLSTPVAEWNMREDRQACRTAEEHHLSLAIKPGDKICAVNGMHDDDIAMAALLAAAADQESPKPVKLTLERARSDVLGPQAPLPPKPPTSGGRFSNFWRRRSNSNPDARHASSQSSSSASDATAPGTYRRKSESDVSRFSPPQWSSMLSAPPLPMRGLYKGMDDESSTRAPSASLSGRSSSVCSERGPPIIIKTNKTRECFSRVGRATFSR